MKRLKKLPNEGLFIDNAKIVFIGPTGEKYLIGEFANKFEAWNMTFDLNKLFTLPDKERAEKWQKLGVDRG